MTDLQALDDFLSSDRSPDHCMQLSDLDGFLTGIICSPDLIVPSTWLPLAMGDPDVGAPAEIVELIMARYNDIVAGLNSEPPMLEPIYWQAEDGQVIAMDWCEGFMEAYALCADRWDELLHASEGQEWMFPIFAHLLDEDGNSLVGARHEQMDALIDTAAEQIPQSIPKLFNYWKADRPEELSN